jgi:hypothetical protein
MASGEAAQAQPHALQSTVFPNRLFRVPRTGRIEPAAPAKHEAETHLVGLDPRSENGAQHHSINVLKVSSQEPARQPAKTTPPLPRRSRRQSPDEQRVPNLRKLRASACSAGTLLARAVSLYSDSRRPPPSGSRRRPAAVDHRSSPIRTRRSTGPRCVVPPDKPFGTPSAEEVVRSVVTLVANPYRSRSQAVSSFAPPSRQHGSTRLRAHSNAKAMGLLSAPAIRLKRPLHTTLSLTLDLPGPEPRSVVSRTLLRGTTPFIACPKRNSLSYLPILLMSTAQANPFFQRRSVFCLVPSKPIC